MLSPRDDGCGIGLLSLQLMTDTNSSKNPFAGIGSQDSSQLGKTRRDPSHAKNNLIGGSKEFPNPIWALDRAFPPKKAC